MDCPAMCPDVVYQLMLDCWMRRPRDRITMTSARHKLGEIRHRRSNLPSSSSVTTMTTTTTEVHQLKLDRPSSSEISGDLSRSRIYLELTANEIMKDDEENMEVDRSES